MLARAALLLALALAAAPLGAACAPAAAQPATAPAPTAAAGVILAAHNEHRARHCAPPLAWSPAVARAAQAWANRLARDCSFRHSGTTHGENLWAGTDGAFPPRRVVESWYGEVAKYDFARPGFAMNTGHFTQLVWVGTRRLGCGTATCKGTRIWVCNYDPAGNVEGQFQRNVRPTSCKR